jgi:hypothetical protein
MRRARLKWHGTSVRHNAGLLFEDEIHCRRLLVLRPFRSDSIVPSAEGEIPVSNQEPLKLPPRKFLNKIISPKNRDGFIGAVNSGTLGDYFHKLTGFPIATASDLGLDWEGRLFGPEISLENKILDVPGARL